MAYGQQQVRLVLCGHYVQLHRFSGSHKHIIQIVPGVEIIIENI